VYDNDDETGKTLTLSPQESQTINLDWTVESNAPEGEYDAQVAVWEESDRNNLSAQLDEEWEYGSFGVEDSEPVDGNIFGINPATGTYTEDDTVTTTVGVKNTGDTSNVFYIGYSVHGPDGGVYDNEETTGETVSLAEGDEQVLDVEWDVEAAAPDGVYDIQVSVWKEPDPDDLQTRLDDQWEHGTFEIEQDDDITGQITAISPAHGQYDGDDSVMTSATIKNTGTVEHSFFVQYTVYGPEASEFHNSHDAGQEVHVQPNESQTIELTWDVEPDAPDGDYDVEIALWEETNPENLENHIDEERESNAFEIVRSDTDYSVAVRDFEDNPVSDAVVRLSSPNNNRTLEEQVNTTQVTFEDLTENEYHYEIESVERNQSDSGVLYTDNPIKQYTAHFPPIGHPHGVVLDDENGFVVPYAEIEIPELGVQTRSDKAGYFDISEKIPKGKYDIRVAVPDGGTIETSAQFGPEYAITLEADSERVSREDSVDGDSYLGDIVESDVLTNLLLETEAIRERIRNGGRAVATAIHGAIRGVAAALYDIFDSIWEVLNVIYENIGIPDFGSLISDLFDIVTNLPTAIAAIGQSLIAGIENFVENASNRQHDVNPHSDYLENTTNPSTSDPEYTWYRTFAGGWGFGYFGFKLLELLAGIGVIRRAGKSIITSGPQAVRDALDTIESTATSLASGTSRGMVSPVGRSGRTMSRSNSGSTSTFDNVLASGLGVARVASANIIKKVRTGIGEIRHKPNEAIGDEIEDTIKNIGEPSQGLGDVQRMKGKLNEWASIGHWVNNENAFRALPSIRSGHVVGKFDISDYNHGDWVLVPKVDRGSSGELDGVLVQVIKNDGEATVTNMKIIEFKKGTDTTDGDRIDPLQERTNKFNTVEKIQNLPGDREIAGTGLRARHFDEVEKKNVYLIGNRKHTGFIRDNPERTPTAADRKWDGYADYASTEIDEYYDALAGLDSQQRRIEFSAPE